MQWLKQSTATTVKLGPFFDEDDGKTEEVGLTISQADIRLSKNGAAFAQTNNAAGATHDENGWYGVPLDTTDTGTLGRLTVAIHESGALAVWEKYLVVPANVYDSLFLGTDYLQADAVEISGDSTAANNAESFFDGTGYAGTNNVIPTVTTLTGHTAQTGDNFARIGAPVGASISADIADVPTVAEMNARTLAAADYFDPAADAVANVTLVATTTTNTDMRGTDSAALATVCTETRLAELDAANLPTDIADVPTVAEFNARTIAAADYFDPVNDAVASVTLVDTTTTNTDMRGTDNAALAATALTDATWTDARAGYLDELDAANLPTDIADIPTVAEFNARTQPTADYFDPAADEVALVTLVTTTTTNTDMRGTDNAALASVCTEGRLAELDAANLPADVAALNDLSAADVNAEVVDVLRTDTIPDSYAADGAQPTIAQAILAIQQFLQERAVSGTTVTVIKPGGGTAMTFTLDDATDPTSITRAT